MTTEVTIHDGLKLCVHDYIQCIWENSNNFRRTWKLIHISDMNYYFRDTGDGSVGIMNRDKFHSHIETGYYGIIPSDRGSQYDDANYENESMF